MFKFLSRSFSFTKSKREEMHISEPLRGCHSVSRYEYRTGAAPSHSERQSSRINLCSRGSQRPHVECRNQNQGYFDQDLLNKTYEELFSSARRVSRAQPAHSQYSEVVLPSPNSGTSLTHSPLTSESAVESWSLACQDPIHTPSANQHGANTPHSRTARSKRPIALLYDPVYTAEEAVEKIWQLSSPCFDAPTSILDADEHDLCSVCLGLDSNAEPCRIATGKRPKRSPLRAINCN
ncbi:hypothetical protein HDU91_003512 [Kappamyces sp. JEL0680]|nr:hypothetical protein HDU91_003512 [Kappamyces sp. JEL0680]